LTDAKSTASNHENFRNVDKIPSASDEATFEICFGVGRRFGLVAAGGTGGKSTPGVIAKNVFEGLVSRIWPGKCDKRARGLRR